MYEVKIHNSINEVEKELWDSLADNNIFMCYDWLKTWENTVSFPILFYYILIFNKGKLIGASACYFQKRLDNAPSIDSILLGRLRKFRWMGIISFLPVINCNPRRGYGSHFIFSKELKKDEIIHLHNKLIDIIENIGTKQGASVCFSNVMDNEIFLIQTLLNRGYYKTKSWPLSYLDIKWSSFNEYRLYLKKNRINRKISNEINKNRKSGVVIKYLENIDNHQQRIFELLKMNHQKYSKHTFPLKQNYLQQLKENFGSDVTILAAMKEGEIIGATVELRKGKEDISLEIGIDHNLSQKDLTYFNLAFYEPIKIAITNGVKRIYCGNGIYKTKAKRGYKISDTYLFYKPGKRSPGWLVKIWFLLHYRWITRKLLYIKKLQLNNL